MGNSVTDGKLVKEGLNDTRSQREAMLDVAEENTNVRLPDRYWQFHRAGSLKQPFSSEFCPFCTKSKRQHGIIYFC